MSAAPPPARIVVGIATAGRRRQMTDTLAQLARLAPPPAAVVVAPASPDDFDAAAAAAVPLPCPLQVVHGPRGLTRQRNTILEAVLPGDADLVVFFDDDYYPCADYLGRLSELFAAAPDIVAFTGRPVVDGIGSQGVPHDEAVAVVAQAERTPVANVVKDTYGTYGCNMAFRLAPIRAAGHRFDERLPLYGWLEDIDFSRRLAGHGRIAESTLLRGVHLGTKGGRVSGVRFGYSQVANPVHCIRKGSMSLRYGGRQMARNIAANLLKLARPEPWVDRRGRLKGNLLALRDLAAGRLGPERVLEL